MSKNVACWQVLALSVMLVPGSIVACSSAEGRGDSTANFVQSALGEGGIPEVEPVVLVGAGNPSTDCSNANPSDVTACLACCGTTADRLYSPVIWPAENAMYRQICGQGCAVGTSLGATTPAASALAYASPAPMPYPSSTAAPGIVNADAAAATRP